MKKKPPKRSATERFHFGKRSCSLRWGIPLIVRAGAFGRQQTNDGGEQSDERPVETVVAAPFSKCIMNAGHREYPCPMLQPNLT